jgi:hypothetical protein
MIPSEAWEKAPWPTSWVRAAARRDRAVLGRVGLAAHPFEAVEDAAGDVADADRVLEAGVARGGVGEPGEADLIDPAQALERPAVEDARLGGRQDDRAVDRVADELLAGAGRGGGLEPVGVLAEPVVDLAVEGQGGRRLGEAQRLVDRLAQGGVVGEHGGAPLSIAAGG